MFAGYCVGHFNHRYFVLFLGWMWLGVLYCTYFNSLYVWTEFGLVSPLALLKFVFPLLILMSGMDISWTQVRKGNICSNGHILFTLRLPFSSGLSTWLLFY